MSTPSIFTQMNQVELRQAIETMLAVRHVFDSEGALASAVESNVALQAWADTQVDQLQSELRLACIAYLEHDLDGDDLLSRSLLLAHAYNWIASPPFSVVVTVEKREGSR